MATRTHESTDSPFSTCSSLGAPSHVQYNNVSAATNSHSSSISNRSHRGILSGSDPLFQRTDSASTVIAVRAFEMGFRALSLLAVFLLAVPAVAGGACDSYKRVETTKTWLSPGMVSRPGDVNHKYLPVDAPTGHFVTTDFHSELVYANGDPAPLSEIYFHHWVMLEIVTRDGRDVSLRELQESGSMNPGRLYLGDLPGQPEIKETWAQGGETRHLNCTMQSPYGLVSGGDGVRTQWIANVHGIDIRGALHPMACTECRCDLYTGGNRTGVPEHYPGGLKCCVDEARCKLRDDFNGDDPSLERTYHLKYTWTYIEYDECVVPLTQMRLDITASPERPQGKIEYDIEGYCKLQDFHKPECIEVKEIIAESKIGGNIVYAVSHLHNYGLSATLYSEDGRLICQSRPIYGHGKVAGDEDGYVVGISHCNPSLESNKLGKLKKGEKLRFQVKYSRVAGPHTGVMGLLFLKVAEDANVITSLPLHGNWKIIKV